MRICVTKKDIAKARLELNDGYGLRSSCCPVAQSLKRRGFIRCIVSLSACWLSGRDAYAVNLPYAVTRFIRDFDNDKPVSPITFTIEKAAV